MSHIYEKTFGLFILLLLITATVISSEEAGAATARDNYRTYCIQCHGASGSGGGVNTESMSVQPRDHTDAKGMSGLSDAKLKKAIAEGGLSVSKSVLMPPWRATFNDKELDALVKYLRKLCKCSEGG